MKIDDTAQLDALAWDKAGELLPAVIQHAATSAVLMLGYMNRAALVETLKTRRVTFYSRSRQRLWIKGETSGNHLAVLSIDADCDRDSLLIQAYPAGPVCHEGTPTCFNQPPASAENLAFLTELEGIIASRITENPQQNPASYTARLFNEGPARIAQKIGEEGVEVALAAVGGDDARIVSETADLAYHLLLLLKSRNLSLAHVAQELKSRHDRQTGR